MEREKALKMCLCRMCPSFVDCDEEIAFCHAEIGESNCIKEENGCLCPGCPVLAGEGYQHVFYCTRGSEDSQN